MSAPGFFRKTAQIFIIVPKFEQFLSVFLRNLKLAASEMFDLSLEKVSLSFPCFIYCSKVFFIWFSFLVIISIFASLNSWN